MKRKKATSTEKKLKQLENQLKRVMADYYNLEKRIKKEAALFKKDALARLADKLLGVLDDLERAEAYLKDKGLKMAVERFRQVLASEGIREIKSDNEDFDPKTMDCVALARGPKNKVVETLQKGYILGNEVLRPAKVKVGKGKEEK